MVLQGRAPAASPGERESWEDRQRAKVTLPEVKFLQKPLPAWWDEDFERRPVMHNSK